MIDCPIFMATSIFIFISKASFVLVLFMCNFCLLFDRFAQ